MNVLLVVCLCVWGAVASPQRPESNAWESDCGQSVYEDAGREQEVRIIGGWEARQHEFPWQVSLLYMGSHTCGAVLIGSSTILTAQHCTESRPVQHFRVVVGGHYRSTPTDLQQTLDVASYVEHPDYDRFYLTADIAILKVNEVLEYSEGVRPICRPQDNAYVGVTATVSGWGDDEPLRKLTEDLRYTNLPVISQEECKSHIEPDWIFDDMICAMDGWNGDRDSCYGDSGGPLAYKNEEGRFELIGLVSWGMGCTAGPGVYTRVSHYADWVQENS